MDEKPLAVAPRDWHPIARWRHPRQWRWYDWVEYAVLVGAVAVAYLHLTAPPPSITRANYDRISAGMSEREVERIVGTRPGGYELFSGPGKKITQEWAPPERRVQWGNRYGILSVGFDAAGRVCWKRLEHHPRAVPERPDLWPWWKRLHNRWVPSPEPQIMYISF